MILASSAQINVIAWRMHEVILEETRVLEQSVRADGRTGGMDVVSSIKHKFKDTF